LTDQEFDAYLQKRLEEILKLRGEKAKEYSNGDAFSHLKTASEIIGVSPEEVALMYALKHFVSIRDIVKTGRNKDKIKEKVSDLVVYLFLIEAYYEANSL